MAGRRRPGRWPFDLRFGPCSGCLSLEKDRFTSLLGEEGFDADTGRDRMGAAEPCEMVKETESAKTLDSRLPCCESGRSDRRLNHEFAPGKDESLGSCLTAALGSRFQGSPASGRWCLPEDGGGETCVFWGRCRRESGGRLV